MSVTEAKIEGKIDDDEISVRLSDIVIFFKQSRTSIIMCGLIFLFIGTVYAFSKSDQFTSEVTVMPEIQSKSGALGGGLSSLAGLAGIDIGGAANGSVDAIRPDIYPNVLKSVPFALQLLKQPVYSILLKKQTSLQTFIEEQKKQSWFSKFINSNEEEVLLPDPQNHSKTLQITKKQEEFINTIHKSVSTTYDKKTGIIMVDATMSDPVVAATVARLSLEYLTNYIISYRTEKARGQVRFLTIQVEDAKKRYQQAEYALSSYRDRNRSLFLETAKLEEQRLQGDFMLSQNVYNELSKQLEQAKIKVSEESPVFKILEPARIPLRKSAPKRLLTIVAFTVVGMLLGVLVFGLRKFTLNS